MTRDATVDTAVRDGYRHMMNGDSAWSCDRWADAWNALRPRLAPQMRTTAAAAVFVESQPLIQGFAVELSNACRRRPRLRPRRSPRRSSRAVVPFLAARLRLAAGRR